MNQRIREFAKQLATNLLNRSGYDMREYEPFLQETEKLVEAIVKECIDVAKQQHNPATLNYKPSERFVEALQQHFGVEE